MNNLKPYNKIVNFRNKDSILNRKFNQFIIKLQPYFNNVILLYIKILKAIIYFINNID